MVDIDIKRLQVPFLKIAPNQEGFALHRAALEWDIQEPIVIESTKDIKSEASWRKKLDPFQHQVRNLMSFCRRLPVTLLADDVGLGKTISAGLILSELVARNRVTKALVVCPKILMPQWQEELASKFNIESMYDSGKVKVEKMVSRIKCQEKGVLITTYSSAQSHLDLLEKAGFQMLILDEAHKLRNLYGTSSAPQVAVRIKKTLSDRTFKYVLMLTATPIHNRLWDLYSLIDLMTVAKGHQNPLGSESYFADHFIADSRTQARQLNPRYRDEFRSIVYGYMSRVRRTDANLTFPERKIKLHKVSPTGMELQLIQEVGRVIGGLNKLVQISLLKAVVSSPQALIAQLEHMATNGTIRLSAVAPVVNLSQELGITAKLQGLEALIEKLRLERPKNWRVVVFTQLRETQNAIVTHLESKKIAIGVINGQSGPHNQETIKRFSTPPPEINVIVSTDAGAEGLNLQLANVLVNYDLPWNPMIVEQRIGRVQRLGSSHKNVLIFNTILEGTFEEYIVARLMEKLLLVNNAIGDIDSLLEAAGLDGEGEGEVSSFEDMIRKLVLASLEGKDVEEDTRRRIESIAYAKKELETEEENMNALLGGGDDPLKKGPRAPKLSPSPRSMTSEDFARRAMRQMGHTLRDEGHGIFINEGTSERLCFEARPESEDDSEPPTLYLPGKPEFDRLVGKFSSESECFVEGLSNKLRDDLKEICVRWIELFGGESADVFKAGIIRSFEGTALLRARVIVAHDSFEKIIEVNCRSASPVADKSRSETEGVNPAALGIPKEIFIAAITQDPDVLEFCRFYTERRTEEMKAAGDDARKRTKLKDDFTPSIEPSLVGLSGAVTNTTQVGIRYKLDGHAGYSSIIHVDGISGALVSPPAMETCESSGKKVPADALGRCAVSGKHVLRHLLQKSEHSDLWALPEHIVTCAISGKRIVSSETALSALSKKPCIRALMKTSAISGQAGEPEFFGKCSFSNDDVLAEELVISEVSSRPYRKDQEAQSAVTGQKGHQSEFIKCTETGKTLLLEEAVRSTQGKPCLPAEAVICDWDGQSHHPDDIDSCKLTGVHVCRKSLSGRPRILKQLAELLNTSSEPVAQTGTDNILAELSKAVGEGHYRVIRTSRSDTLHALAVTVESRRFFGFFKRVLGFVLYRSPKSSLS